MPTRLDGVLGRSMSRSRYNSVMDIAELRLESDRRLGTVLLTLALIPAVWFGVIDAMAPPGAAGGSAHAVPSGAVVVIVALGLWFVARARTRAQYSLAMFATSLAIVPVLLAVALLRGWFHEPSQAFLPLIAMYGATPNSVGRQIVPPLLLTACLLAGRALWFPGVGDDPMGDTLVVIIVNAIGIVMVLRRAALQRLVAGAFEELQALRGIIPICAHCKKVRTDADEWQQIEKYVREHSVAEFSHGICPDCIRKFYPDDADLAPR